MGGLWLRCAGVAAMLLTVAVAAADFKQGETVEAQWGGEWKRARIIAAMAKPMAIKPPIAYTMN